MSPKFWGQSCPTHSLFSPRQQKNILWQMGLILKQFTYQLQNAELEKEKTFRTLGIRKQVENYLLVAVEVILLYPNFLTPITSQEILLALSSKQIQNLTSYYFHLSSWSKPPRCLHYCGSGMCIVGCLTECLASAYWMLKVPFPSWDNQNVSSITKCLQGGKLPPVENH